MKVSLCFSSFQSDSMQAPKCFILYSFKYAPVLPVHVSCDRRTKWSEKNRVDAVKRQQKRTVWLLVASQFVLLSRCNLAPRWWKRIKAGAPVTPPPPPKWPTSSYMLRETSLHIHCKKCPPTWRRHSASKVTFKGPIPCFSDFMPQLKLSCWPQLAVLFRLFYSLGQEALDLHLTNFDMKLRAEFASWGEFKFTHVRNSMLIHGWTKWRPPFIDDIVWTHVFTSTVTVKNTLSI